MQAQSVPNDPLFGQLWGLRNVGQNVGGVTGGLPGADIDAVLAWDRTVGDPSVVVADIDTGYRFDDPDLGPVAWTNPGEIAGDGIDNDHNGYIDDTRGWDAIGWKPTPVSPLAPDNDPTDARILDDGHGVHTAGTIGAQGNNGVGVTGVAQNVRIMPFRAGDAMGFPTSAIVEGMNYAGRNGARVANMSFTGYFRSGWRWRPRSGQTPRSCSWPPRVTTRSMQMAGASRPPRARSILRLLTRRPDTRRRRARSTTWSVWPQPTRPTRSRPSPTTAPRAWTSRPRAPRRSAPWRRFRISTARRTRGASRTASSASGPPPYRRPARLIKGSSSRSATRSGATPPPRRRTPHARRNRRRSTCPAACRVA